MLLKGLSNMYRFITSLSLAFILFTCNDTSSGTNEQVETTAKPTSVHMSDVDADSIEQSTVMARSAPAVPELSVDFPEDQIIIFGTDDLGRLCDHKYGCIEEKLCALGWSADGKFAFMLQEANEAVLNTTIHFTIQDMESDEVLEKHTFKASNEPDWSEETDNYSIMGIWRKNEILYDSLVRRHQIQLGAGSSFYPMSTLEDKHAILFQAQDKMRHNTLFDIQEVDQHRIVANTADRRSKIICRQMMSKYDMVIASQPLGGFSSPFEDRLAILDGLEKRGYEGPPNVLRLQLVGCDLRKGVE